MYVSNLAKRIWHKIVTVMADFDNKLFISQTYSPTYRGISHETLDGGLVPIELVDVREKVICVHWVRPWSKLKVLEYRPSLVGAPTSVIVSISWWLFGSLVLNTVIEYLSNVTVGGTKLSDQVTSIDVEFSSWRVTLEGEPEAARSGKNKANTVVSTHLTCS